MTPEFSAARRIAEAVRYLDDPPRTGLDSQGSRGEIPDFQNAFGRNALRITSQVTPELNSIITTALRRLRCPLETIEAYVYPSPEFQASCISGGDTECVMTISSGLVELLEADEMTFVVGHEIGHFLLRHGEEAHSAHGFLPQRLIAGRRMEISADRMGLIACSSLDASIWAMMKIFSGLPKSHLNFDVGEFIAQIGEADTKRCLRKVIKLTRPKTSTLHTVKPIGHWCGHWSIDVKPCKPAHACYMRHTSGTQS